MRDPALYGHTWVISDAMDLNSTVITGDTVIKKLVFYFVI
jgi:hypothetical protein